MNGKVSTKQKPIHRVATRLKRVLLDRSPGQQLPNARGVCHGLRQRLALQADRVQGVRHGVGGALLLLLLLLGGLGSSCASDLGAAAGGCQWGLGSHISWHSSR